MALRHSRRYPSKVRSECHDTASVIHVPSMPVLRPPGSGSRSPRLRPTGTVMIRVASITRAKTVSELRDSHGAYAIFTPDEAVVAALRNGRSLALHPLCGRLPDRARVAVPGACRCGRGDREPVMSVLPTVARPSGVHGNPVA